VYSIFHVDNQTRNQLIRRRHAAGESQTTLAREFGISPQRVYQIIHHKNK
jgi:DNA-binding XRE family transcriptional regulator